MRAYRVTISGTQYAKSVIEVLASNPCEAIEIVIKNTQIEPPRRIKAEPCEHARA